jgi:Osmosensitive K+ channel histidine kinase
MNDLITNKLEQPEMSNPVLFRFEFGFDYEQKIVSQQYNFMQHVLSIKDIHFDIDVLDSIFSSCLIKENLPLKYQLIYSDSLNNRLKSSGWESIKGFQTEKLPIVDGYQIHAIVKITLPVILKNMLVILIVSICIFISIIACMIYLINMFISQHQLNQLRENFTHALTHDMKTPLGSIFTILDQLRKGTMDHNPEMKEQFLQIGIDQSVNLQAIVNQILTVAYIDKKQLSLNIELIDIQKMIKDLIDKFTIKGGKDITFSVTCELNEIPVFADRLYLSNAISNLIDNAIKYSGDAVRIEIQCTTSNEQIYIRVSDDGLGISKQDQQKIFDRFERGDEIKRNKISGFGLGLNYVKAIIEAHGGTIGVYSELGKGSEFIITIPVSDYLNEKQLV